MTPSPTNRHYSFYTTAEYLHTLAQRIAKTRTKQRVVLFTLWLVPGEPAIDTILEAAYAAARRGVEVLLVVDAFTFLIKKGATPGPAFFFGKSLRILPKTFRARMTALQRLEEAGGQYAIIHRPKRPLANPFIGRSHVKFSVIDNEVFVGGCNLAIAENTDLMIGWQDQHTANWLYDFAKNVMASGSVTKTLHGRDVSLPVDATTTLLMDAGMPGHSIIMDRALTLVDEARDHLLITYQYYPSSVVADRLELADSRGVATKILYNHPAKHPTPLNHLYGVLAWSARRRKPESFLNHRLSRGQPFLHAKLIATDKGAIVGSHNYMTAGVALGTAEIALMSSDPRFAARATEVLERQIRLGK